MSLTLNDLMHTHLQKSRNLLPLLRPGVHTGGVVSASVQQDHTLLWDFLLHKNNMDKSTYSTQLKSADLQFNKALYLDYWL